MFTPAASYRFGPFVLDASAYRLVREAEPLSLSPKALDLLFLFAGRPGALFTKDAILAELWPDVAVTDNALTQVVSEVRQALGDVPAAPRYVETVPRRGYRFVADVDRLPPADAGVGGGLPADAPAVRRSIAVLPFTNLSNDRELAWLSSGLAETITNALRAVRDIRVVDRPPAIGAPGPAASAVEVVISGGFQRAGDRLRVTAEAIDPATREALAHAKADGVIEEVFRMQDEIVTDLVRGLRLQVTPAAEARLHARETASLGAYRALTEGRLKLETLDPALVAAAMADFERARTLDPSYALAFVGLAHARFWQFQATRAANRPDRAALADAIAHARHAVDLDPELAEGHAALAFFLASADRPREAVAAGRVATALEPANWRHQFRLGIAAWGEERRACLDAVVRVFPQMGHAHFASAMLDVARGQLANARATLERAGAGAGARAVEGRFPAAGLDWLLGLIHLAAHDGPSAEAAFERELSQQGRSFLAAEYAMDAWSGWGYARLAAGDAAGAAEKFTRALERFPGHAKSLVGLADAQRRLGRASAARDADARATTAIAELRDGDRPAEAAMAAACQQAIAGRVAEAIGTLDDLLTTAPPGPAGWTLPIEPFAAPLRGHPSFARTLARLGERAR